MNGIDNDDEGDLDCKYTECENDPACKNAKCTGGSYCNPICAKYDRCMSDPSTLGCADRWPRTSTWDIEKMNSVAYAESCDNGVDDDCNGRADRGGDGLGNAPLLRQ